MLRDRLASRSSEGHGRGVILVHEVAERIDTVFVHQDIDFDHLPG